MKIIKMVTRGSTEENNSLYRYQSPHNSAIWNNCQFIFNPLVEKYDWFVVFDNMPNLTNNTEVLNCPKENTILVTSEPSSISFYGRGYAGQFHYLITNQNASILPHENAQRSQTGIYWLYGKDFDDITKDNHGFKKIKKISTICSDKKEGHTMHKKRYDFTALAEKKIDALERFGRGFQFVEKKYQAIDDYQFHIVIENHIEKHMWSEKLADAFLGFCIPIYCGAPNIYDYFPKESLILIDLEDFEGSINKIKEIISIPGEYERRFEAVKEARRRVIEEYNLLAMISKIVEKSSEYKFQKGIKIYSRRQMRLRYLPDLLRFFWFRIKGLFKGNFKLGFPF